MNQNHPATWLPEPSISDDSYARRDEHVLDWLSRSTGERARDCRRFLNEHLSKLPEESQRKFLHNLRHQWHSTFFELIVARLLQELGASLVIENTNHDGKRPDFAAQFQDVGIIVEATTPLINLAAKNQLKGRNPLLEFVESRVPEGWQVGVWQLPNIGPADSKKEFKRLVEKMLSQPSPNKNDTDKELIEELPSGIIHLHLWPRISTHKSLAWETPVTVIDNSSERIRHAVRNKRKQVRNSNTPVLLAIQVSGISSRLEDLNTALFGHSYGRYDKHLRLVETGFRPDGIFNEQREPRGKPPTFAGVLAFLTVGFNACPAPVLYHHPRFSETLPAALQELEQRIYNEESSTIQIQPSKSHSFVERLNFVNI